TDDGEVAVVLQGYFIAAALTFSRLSVAPFCAAVRGPRGAIPGEPSTPRNPGLPGFWRSRLRSSAAWRVTAVSHASVSRPTAQQTHARQVLGAPDGTRAHAV